MCSQDANQYVLQEHCKWRFNLLCKNVRLFLLKVWSSSRIILNINEAQTDVIDQTTTKIISFLTDGVHVFICCVLVLMCSSLCLHLFHLLFNLSCYHSSLLVIPVSWIQDKCAYVLIASSKRGTILTLSCSLTFPKEFCCGWHSLNNVTGMPGV